MHRSRLSLRVVIPGEAQVPVRGQEYIILAGKVRSPCVGGEAEERGVHNLSEEARNEVESEGGGGGGSCRQHCRNV